MNNLDSFFRPDTIAVIGASRDPNKIGHSILQNFKEGDFPGKVIPVNPNADEILGYDVVDSVKDIEKVDHAVISVPPGVANQVVQECVDADVPAVTIITSGYEEIGEEGKKRQQELQN
ncbi:MAG: CoA-binding protein, partial [Candidatus Nanohaloarchaea archaeon]|nr:CoA-binding protein [Candidatus Nanohaloarchaea archaeon]